MFKSRSGKLAKIQKSTILCNSRVIKKPKFLTFKAKEAFNLLQQAFSKVLIFQHSDPEYHIPMETNVLGIGIEGVPSQLTLDYLNSGSNLFLIKSDFS